MITLYPYQEEAIEFIKKAKKVYLAMGLGTGKTLTSLIGATQVSKKKNVLVIAELNEIENSRNFEKEVKNHIDGWDYISLREDKNILNECSFSKQVCGINPDMLPKLPFNKIKDLFDVVIVDEATLAKTTTTERFKSVLKVCKEMEYVILLSGTPMLNGASEIYAPLLLLGHSLGGKGRVMDKQAFDVIFAGGYKRKIKNTGNPFMDYIWWAKGTNNVRELRYLIKDNFFFVRKEDVKGVFKKKTRGVKEVIMSLEWLAEYQKAWSDYIATLPARFGDLTEKQLKKKLENISELQKLIENSQIAQVNSKWKAREIVKDIKSGEYGDNRIIVYTGFVETYELLKSLCEDNNISYNVFENVADYKKGSEQVLIGRIKAHGKGGNVPEACITLFTDMDFVCSNNLQAENRIDRPEQTKEMRVIYYLAKDEDVDLHIRNINKEKTRHIEEFMRPICEEELLVLPNKVSDLKGKFSRQFALLLES